MELFCLKSVDQINEKVKILQVVFFTNYMIKFFEQKKIISFLSSRFHKFFPMFEFGFFSRIESGSRGLNSDSVKAGAGSDTRVHSLVNRQRAMRHANIEFGQTQARSNILPEAVAFSTMFSLPVSYFYIGSSTKLLQNL